MTLKPLGDRVVIKKVEEEENKTASGIVLPDSAKEESHIAEVVAISDDIKNDDKKKDALSEGDRVIYSKYAGNEFEIDGDKVIVINYSDLLAVLA